MSEILVGEKEVRARLRIFAQRATAELGAALYQEALLVEQVSRMRTPVLTGALRASHETSNPVYEKDSVAIEIRVGGPSAPYAVFVHEKVELHHRVGQAKFLESAVLEAAPGLADRVAQRTNLGRLR